ncbi:tRNA pseudouridine(13) synthase TruD [Archaeoglobus sp.]
MEDVVGIRTYITSHEGINGIFKESPEDFYVEEVADLKFGDGDWVVLKVKKVNWDTLNFVRVLSNRLRISQKRISYAGTKDKRAVSVQNFALKIKSEDELERLRNLSIKDAEIEIVGRTNRPIQLGDLKGNVFKVVVRKAKNVENIPLIESELRAKGTPNFFGLQRFGSIRFVTHEVGKFILKRDYETAFWIYVAKPFEGESEEARRVREILWNTRDIKFGLKELPKYLRYERTLLQKLREGKSEKDALLSLPENLKMMFVHAYQSYVFNNVLSDRIEEFGSLKVVERGDWVDFVNLNDHYTFREDFVNVHGLNFRRVKFLIDRRLCALAIPLPGYETVLGDDWTSERIRFYLERDGIDLKDFKHEYKEFSSKGSFRVADILIEHTNFKYEIKGDVTFNFYLPKGCYATILLREFVKKPLF